MLPTELFISHSDLDRHFADSIATTLRDHGIPVWYSQTGIIGAQQWLDEIGKALKRCDWFIVILSPNSVRSRWVKQEVAFALNASKFDDKLIPVLYQPCDHEDLSWPLSVLQMVDFSEDLNKGFRELLEIWDL
jgi:hypothetical protein